jgi:cystathionine beta-lyase
MGTPGITADDLSLLRARTSQKWVMYPDDVLPLFVAEMDYPLAPVVAEAIVERVRRSDTGYVQDAGEVAPALAGFAADRWGWTLDPGDVRVTTDVGVAIVETLRVSIEPGAAVIVTPPVYPPFFELVVEAGGVVREVPLLRDGPTWALDLDGLDRAFADGAQAFVLCNPHNPVGLPHPRSELVQVAALAERHGVVVVSDEIHGPLTHDSGGFTPFLSVSDAAREVGVTTLSASKAFNLAGVKCAAMVASSARTRALLARQPEEVTWRTSLLGRAANAAAFRHGGPWLDATIAAIVASKELLRSLVTAHLPSAVLHEPRASFLAWIDFSDLGWGPDPAAVALARGRVALSSGPLFGRQGDGFARLNFACSAEVLTEAISRLASIE